MEQYFEFRKVRDFGTVMNDSFDFIRQEFKRFGKTILIYVLPFFVFTGILLVYFQTSMYSTILDGSVADSVLNIYYKMIPSYIVMLLNYTVLTAVIYQYINLYRKTNGNFTAEELWPGVLKVGLKILGVYFVSFVIVIIASMFLLVPGIYLGVVFSFFPAAIIFEELSFGQAMNRCFAVIKDNWWRTFGIIFIGGLIVYIFSMIVSVPLIIATALKTFHAVSNNSTPGPQFFSTGYIIASTVISMFQNLGYSLVLIFVAVQYFSLVEVKERPTLQDKIDKLVEETNE